jgi:hypothetical protein
MGSHGAADSIRDALVIESANITSGENTIDIKAKEPRMACNCLD